MQDKLSISSRDGTSSDIIVTIGGNDEPVVVSNPADSTLLNFNYSEGGGSNGSIVHVDVILVGYTGFTSGQLQAQF